MMLVCAWCSQLVMPYRLPPPHHKMQHHSRYTSPHQPAAGLARNPT